jgi:hypothetical protein
MRIWKLIFWLVIGFTILLALSTLFVTLRASAATNISATTTEHFAWDDSSGWWDFYSGNSVQVQGAQIAGYANSSSAGEMSLDCATSPSGNICGTSNYGVCYGPGPHNVDGTCPNGDAGSSGGNLTGYAWNDVIGWVSFNCDQTNYGGSNQCGTSNYSVNISPSNGDFTGYAWNDLVGWINFNSSNAGAPTSSPYKVKTTYTATSSVATIISDVIDTQVVSGATLNSLTWKGTLNANSKAGATYVDFQIAVSNNSAGPWNFMGPSGTSADYYAATCAANYRGGVGDGAPVDTPICIDPTQVTNMRYLKYLVRLRSNLIQNDTPRVDDVILNWSK